MAERSKALVSGTSLFGGVGSNPTPVTQNFCLARLFVGQGVVRPQQVYARGTPPSVPPSSVGRAQDS